MEVIIQSRKVRIVFWFPHCVDFQRLSIKDALWWFWTTANLHIVSWRVRWGGNRHSVRSYLLVICFKGKLAWTFLQLENRSKYSRNFKIYSRQKLSIGKRWIIFWPRLLFLDELYDLYSANLRMDLFLGSWESRTFDRKRRPEGELYHADYRKENLRQPIQLWLHGCP